MTVARTIAEQLKRASWIRKMFEEGNRLRAERGAENVFDFSLGNPEIEPPESVLAAARRHLDDASRGMHAYMPNSGFPKVREVMAQRMAAATGLPFAASNIIMTVGAGGALNALLKALLDPGDEVVVQAPYFVEYRFYVENHGGRLVVAETRPDFQLDMAAIERALTPRTKVILVNSPNNPTGAIYPAEAYAALERLIAGRPIVVISDEPYKALTFDGARAPEIQRSITNAVVATSWSKALAIPGERIGMIAISPQTEAALALADACTFTNRILGFVNAPALWQWAVAEAADATIDIGPYQEKRDIMFDGLTRIGYRCIKPQGAFYLFPETPVPDDVAFVKILVEEGILAVPGTGFGRAGHMRLSLTVPRDTVVRSIAGFERAFHRAKG
jgi:aspartate aminotransferase